MADKFAVKMIVVAEVQTTDFDEAKMKAEAIVEEHGGLKLVQVWSTRKILTTDDIDDMEV